MEGGWKRKYDAAIIFLEVTRERPYDIVANTFSFPAS